jgi:hypothetical protein
MTVTSERTMTPDGHIAIPLDIAANREPFLTTSKWALLEALLLEGGIGQNGVDDRSIRRV